MEIKTSQHMKLNIYPTFGDLLRAFRGDLVQVINSHTDHEGTQMTIVVNCQDFYEVIIKGNPR